VPELLREVDANAARYHTSRSAIIRWALQEWLEKYPAPAPDRGNPVNTKSINIDRSFHELIKPDMSPDELLATLEEYEAAVQNQV